MENAAKALEIAAGVLLGVLILSLISYFLTNVSSWPQEQEDLKKVEQTSKFNLEYEVYDKKGMYGTDVISCLSKVVNNNEKYYEGGNFLTGNRYGEKYWINVYVNLKSDLEEELVVYHYKRLENSGPYQQVLQMQETDVDMLNAGFISNSTYTTFFEFDEKGIATKSIFLKNTFAKLSSSEASNYIDINTYVDENGNYIGNALGTSGSKYNAWLYEKKDDTVDTNTETPLKILLDMASTNVKQIVTNKDSKTLEKWSSAEWRTALYDFKTRRFKCDNIKYSQETGRVNEIYFSEI